jgi:hypothetical protein
VTTANKGEPIRIYSAAAILESLLAACPSIPERAQLYCARSERYSLWLSENPALTTEAWDALWEYSTYREDWRRGRHGHGVVEFILDSIEHDNIKALILRPLAPAQRSTVLRADWNSGILAGCRNMLVQMVRDAPLSEQEWPLLGDGATATFVAESLERSGRNRAHVLSAKPTLSLLDLARDIALVLGTRGDAWVAFLDMVARRYNEREATDLLEVARTARVLSSTH